MVPLLGLSVVVLCLAVSVLGQHLVRNWRKQKTIGEMKQQPVQDVIGLGAGGYMGAGDEFPNFSNFFQFCRVKIVNLHGGKRCGQDAAEKRQPHTTEQLGTFRCIQPWKR